MAARDMAWYFDRGLASGALLLDGANLDRRAFPLFSEYKRELAEIAAEKGEELGYSYPGGKKELKRLIASHESVLEGERFLPENIVVNSGGCSGTFDNLFRMLARKPGKGEIVIAVPTYPEIIKSVEYSGLTAIKIPTREEADFQPTTDEIVSAVSPRTAAIFLLNPGNPSCRYLQPEAIAASADAARRSGSYLIVDQIFEEAPGAGAPGGTFSQSSGYPKVVKIKGFSKDRPQLNDLRLGWAVSRDEEAIAGLIQAAEMSDFSNSTIAERIAIADMRMRVAIDSGAPEAVRYSKELLEYQKRISEGMATALEMLGRSPAIERVIEPEAGNVIYAKVRSGYGLSGSESIFFRALEKENILISPGRIFGHPEDGLWYRTTMSIEPERFIDGTERVLRAIEQGAP